MRIPVFRLLLSTFLLVSCSDDGTTLVQAGDDCSSSDDCGIGLSCVAEICTADTTNTNNATNNATNNKTNNSTGTSNNATPNCTDGELNQDESAIDCGGTTCDTCDEGMGCSAGTDCASGVCLEDVCAPANCGDGIVNADEACDGDGAGTGGSTATCDIDCTAVECGDGLANTEAGEACDGDGAGTGGETAGCNADCSVNSCGDGQLNVTAGETCDGDNAGTGGETNLCDVDCSAAECGDAVVNTMAGEGCDDGNQIDNDACSNACVPASCGDAVVNNGEACDDGNQIDDDTCNNACVLNVCGDGTVNNGEACDDGNQVDDDACSNACVVAVCGDAVVNNGEACDDGNQVDDDACNNACVLNVCGDAIVNNGEACDDGNQVDDDACNNACVLNVCGDGTVNNGEACDDGNQVNDDACSNACVVNVCGDGTVNNGEACDDGNQVDDDACNNACVLNVCGDGIVNNGEACDDGNQVNDDACSNTCTLPIGPRGTVALCGTSSRAVTQFVPPQFSIVNTCVPSNNMQAMLITRSGLTGFAANSGAIQTYVQNGGKILTEYQVSDDAFNALFPGTVTQGARRGSCQDVMPTAVQFTPGDPFWANNPFNAIAGGSTGCGSSITAFPGLIPLAGWSATDVSVGYRELGSGRVWFTDFDWQDNGNAATFAYTGTLMGYMIDPSVQLTSTPNPAVVFNNPEACYYYGNNLVTSMWDNVSGKIVAGEFSQSGYWSFNNGTAIPSATPDQDSGNRYGRILFVPSTRVIVTSASGNSVTPQPASAHQVGMLDSSGQIFGRQPAVFSDGFSGNCNLSSTSKTEYLCYDGTSVRHYRTTPNSATLAFVKSVTIASPVSPANFWGSTFAWDGEFYYFSSNIGTSNQSYQSNNANGTLNGTHLSNGNGAISTVFFNWSVGRYATHDGYGGRSGVNNYGTGSDSTCYAGPSAFHSAP